MGVSNCSNILLFQKFIASWINIDKSKFESRVTKEYINLTLLPQKNDLILLLCKQLNEFQPRDD